MTSVTTKPDSSQPAAETAVYLFDNWFDPIEGGLRDRVREFIHAMIEGELDIALSRPRYARRQLRFKAAIELAKPRIAVPARIGGDIFIPDDHQGDVLALQLPMNRRPIRLGVPAMTPFGPVISVKRRLQVAVAHADRQGPTQPGALETPQRAAHRRGGDAQTTRDFARWKAGGKLQTNDLARLAHRNSFRWHHRSLGLPKEGP